MPSPLSSILGSIHTALAAWCADTTPVKGTVSIADDALSGYDQLRAAPRSYHVVVWWSGDKGSEQRGDLATSGITVAVAVAKGLTKEQHADLTTARPNGAAVIDILEGICATCRGLYVGSAPGTNAPDSCYLLRYTGKSDWLAFEVANENDKPVDHYVHQFTFELPRQLPARNDLAVTLA